MARIYSTPGSDPPTIDRSSVLRFFEQRAEKVAMLGPTRAVIYQDKNPDLAEKRDATEKALLLPLMQLGRSSRVLDAACGTGRWAEVLIPNCGSYVGFDASEGLIRVARERFGHCQHARFAVCPADGLTLAGLGEDLPFTHILSLGLFIYLNDSEVAEVLERFSNVAAGTARIVVREPIAIETRLTLQGHFSDELEQEYNAIYRTEREMLSFFEETLRRDGFHLAGSGDVYADAALNNRAETKQRWYIWERCA